MSILSRTINYIQYTGDQESELTFDSGDLADSPCLQELVTLAIGNNSITVPPGVHGLALIPPAANVVEIVLKGIGADTGIPLSASQVSVVQLGTLPATIVLNVTVVIEDLRLVWF